MSDEADAIAAAGIVKPPGGKTSKIRPFTVSRYWPFPRLKPYEIQNIAFERGRDRAKYGDWLEQGIGKTLVNYADFYDHQARDLVDIHVVVAPTYLMGNWQTEADEYGLKHDVVIWPDEPTEKQMRKGGFTFVINPEALLISGGFPNRGGVFLEKLLKHFKGRTLFTVDESIIIANHDSQISKRVVALAYEARYHRALSGLPAPENVMQWWSQLRFCGEINGMLPIPFRNRYAKMGGYMNKKCVGYREENAAELFSIIDRSGLRALKEDWLDLPDKIQCPPIEFEMHGRQLTAYKSMLSEFYVEVDAMKGPDSDVYAEQVIHQLMKLQQISRGFIIDTENETVHDLVSIKDNPAVKVLKGFLETIVGKFCIFAYHEHSVKILYDVMEDLGIPCIVIRGGLTREELTERKAAFNGDHSIRGCIGQLSVVKRGHTLLGSGPGVNRCATTIYWENMFSRDTRSQSEDRNHRHGQDEPVSYVDICEKAPGSPTRKAIRALQSKQNFIDATINTMRTRQT